MLNATFDVEIHIESLSINHKRFRENGNIPSIKISCFFAELRSDYFPIECFSKWNASAHTIIRHGQ